MALGTLKLMIVYYCILRVVGRRPADFDGIIAWGILIEYPIRFVAF